MAGAQVNYIAGYGGVKYPPYSGQGQQVNVVPGGAMPYATRYAGTPPGYYTTSQTWHGQGPSAPRTPLTAVNSPATGSSRMLGGDYSFRPNQGLVTPVRTGPIYTAMANHVPDAPKKLVDFVTSPVQHDR